ncbi:hypothetical protein IV203_023874 [Nitzschia inconspicua]|uniref:Uncharacterized protein n=1 Tax=Nitzschia inconspicua TaxID=303405 RepID=A0A9K3PB45_9STRA|nr:hypothetical protein IV203_023874 [Nitzschia inconspicua]
MGQLRSSGVTEPSIRHYQTMPPTVVVRTGLPMLAFNALILYVARNNKIDIGLWKPHFRIRKNLDVASPPLGQNQSTSSGYVPSMEGDGPECVPPREDDEPNGSQSDSVMHEVNGNIQEKLNYGLKYMQRVAQQLLYDIFNCRHEKTRHMFAGTILQLHEHILGNETTAHGTSADDSSKRWLNQFTRNMSSQTMFVQDDETRHNKENVMTEQPVLKQARPKGSNGEGRQIDKGEHQAMAENPKDRPTMKDVWSTLEQLYISLTMENPNDPDSQEMYLLKRQRRRSTFRLETWTREVMEDFLEEDLVEEDGQDSDECDDSDMAKEVESSTKKSLDSSDTSHIS